MPQREMVDAALRYARQGWSVFPLIGKKPTPGSAGHRDASTDRDTIRHWWSLYPDANIGIACSSERGPIVLDLDGPSGVKYAASLNLPDTYAASSRNDTRRHLYFGPMLDGTRIKRAIRPLGQDISLDVLGDGGYVVAPPSIHPVTHRRYRWLHRPDLKPAPPALLGILSQRDVAHSNADPLPSIIGEGRRDELLTSLAGSMRRRGASEEAILAALREENATRVVPPLSERQLEKIARSIASKKPAGYGEHLTDLGNARRFVEQNHEAVRCVTGRRSHVWYNWDGPRWTNTDPGEVERLAKQTVRALYQEAQAAGDGDVRDSILKHAAKSEASPRVHAILDLAATEPEIALSTEAFDRDHWLFNVENGTIDLRTGLIHGHKREDLVTKLAPVEYNPKAKAPRWEKFIREIMRGDTELMEFLQRMIGYAMTGDTREQCLFFCYGQGSNGKSTFLEVIRELFGDYGQQSDFNTFLARNSDGPRNDLARMRGARLVTAVETSAEKGFDAQVLKQLTGGDTVTARKLYEEFFEFKPQHKLILAANHKPIVKEQTRAFWRRIRLVPFMATFTDAERDKKLTSTLVKTELPGILNWAIAGSQRWRKDGLNDPVRIVKATASYRDENDLLAEFIASQCVLDRQGWASTTALFHGFNEWWLSARGSKSIVSLAWFSRLLAERPELTVVRKGGIRGWRGIQLKQEFHA